MYSLRRQCGKLLFYSHSKESGLLPNAMLKATRNYSVLDQPYTRKRLVSPWLGGVLIAGVALTGYGGFVLYQTLTIWPPEVRSDLRDAVSAKFKGELETSERHFHRAWDTIQTLPIQSIGSQPYLKITGLAVAFADILETSNKPERAYEVYTHALELLQKDAVKETLTGPERLRAVAIASKLGQLSKELDRPKTEEEKWLVWAVEELLRIVKNPAKSGGQDEPDYHHEGKINLPMLALPSWISKTDIGAPLEALGSFYAQAGRLDFATPLYLQAISLLIPPAPKKSSIEDRCRGAQLMGNLSEMIMRGKPTPETLHQAEAWAAQALAVTKKARGEAARPIESCEDVYAASLFNVAMFREMAGDKQNARQLYKDGLEQARAIGMTEGIVEASRALHRLDMEEQEDKTKAEKEPTPS